ncbi:MAG: hypothetical protein HS122_01290 [Opitutaceae bacterium]|nr:hypothetical protein [Opitutaceae bacterium]
MLLGVAFVVCRFVGRYWGHVFEVQIAGAALAVFASLAAGQAVSPNGWLIRRVIVLGQYSLPAYVLQIAILQVILRLVGRPDPWSSAFYLWMLVTTVVMTLLIEALAALRRVSPPSDRIYRFIFA